MPLTPFGAYSPDLSDYEGATSQNIFNVLPRGDGYGPFPSLLELSGALGAACRGAFVAIKTDGSVVVFAATTTGLFLMSNTDYTWSDVSKDATAYTALPATDNWQFAQFNDLVIAVQANANPQVFTLASSSAFEDLAGSPPKAGRVNVVGRFLVLSQLTSNPGRIEWSGLNSVNASDSWTSGTNSSDFQDFADGGHALGVSGDETSGVIFQNNAIRRMTYAPGSPVIFQIDKVTDDLGLFAPYSLVRSGSRVFFLSQKGFQMMDPSGYPTAIGKERVDRHFLANLDKDSLRLMIGGSDPRSSRVFWVYKSLAGAAAQFDRAIVYDYALDKWSPSEVSGEMLLSLAQPGLTLEDLDDISSSIDDLLTSLDSFPSTAATPELAAFSSAHKLGFFRGPNQEAIFETAEQGTDGKRLRINGVRPITDAVNVYASCSKRENLKTATTQSVETLSDDQGTCPQIVSSRYSRVRVRIPAAELWTYAVGVEIDVRTEGTR